PWLAFCRYGRPPCPGHGFSCPVPPVLSVAKVIFSVGWPNDLRRCAYSCFRSSPSCLLHHVGKTVTSTRPHRLRSDIPRAHSAPPDRFHQKSPLMPRQSLSYMANISDIREMNRNGILVLSLLIFLGL